MSSSQQKPRTEIDMSQSSRITRVASAIGVGGIAVLALFVPTAAFGEEHATGPSSGPSSGIDVRAMLKDIDRPLPAYVAPLPYSPPEQILVDDNSVELLQLALGAAAGTAVTAAGLVAFTARNRRRSAHLAS